MIHQPLGGAQGQASDIKIMAEEIIKTKKILNTILSEQTNKDLSVSIDISQKSSWENNLTSYIDEIPFQFSGKIATQNT